MLWQVWHNSQSRPIQPDLVRQGWARDWPEYSDGYYRQAEAQAWTTNAGGAKRVPVVT